jgi:hypothetical protein
VNQRPYLAAWTRHYAWKSGWKTAGNGLPHAGITRWGMGTNLNVPIASVPATRKAEGDALYPSPERRQAAML